MQINPVSLTDSARAMEDVADDVRDLTKTPRLYADDCIRLMKDSPLASALKDADKASAQAKDVVEKRLLWMAHLLYSTAKSYRGTDATIADSLAAMGELNGKGQ